jgi:hypothetical protein
MMPGISVVGSVATASGSASGARWGRLLPAAGQVGEVLPHRAVETGRAVAQMRAPQGLGPGLHGELGQVVVGVFGPAAHGVGE